MKKIYCYSKIASLIHLLVFIISLIVGFLPFFLFKGQEDGILELLWIINITFCMSFSAIGFLRNIQYLYVQGNKLILKNLFGTIKALDINYCYYEVTRLQSYYGRKYNLGIWICIYSIDETNMFKYGFSNGKKHERIQLTYNKENLKFVSSYVKKKEFVIK